MYVQNEPATDEACYFGSMMTAGNDDGNIENLEAAYHT